MDPISFLKSPVAIGTLVSAVTGVLAMFGRSIPNAVITDGVTHVLDAIATLSAAFALYKRWRSPIQPLAISQASADRKAVAKDSGVPPALVLAFINAALVMLFCIGVSTLSACGSLAIGRAQTLEQKGAALLGDFTLYQRASLKIGEDQSVPQDARRAVLTAEVAAKPAADKLDDALREYRAVHSQLAAGQTTDEKVKIATSHLQQWIGEVTPLVLSLRKNVEAATTTGSSGT